MYIERIQVKNFRLLHDFSIDLRQGLSLVVGKNNSGKTSLLKVMDKFINGKGSKFLFEDFSLTCHPELERLFSPDVIEERDYKDLGIYMCMLIRYNDADDLEYISPLVSLDMDHYYVCLQFSYSLSYTLYCEMRTTFDEFQKKEKAKKDSKPNYEPKQWQDFLKSNLSRYFKIYRTSIPVDKDGRRIDGDGVDLQSIQDVFDLENVISFKYIDARRSVDNKEVDKTLSEQTYRLYQEYKSNDVNEDTLEGLRDNLHEMDIVLSDNYNHVFKDITGKVKSSVGYSLTAQSLRLFPICKREYC